jgi:hypothetical protein
MISLIAPSENRAVTGTYLSEKMHHQWYVGIQHHEIIIVCKKSSDYASLTMAARINGFFKN